MFHVQYVSSVYSVNPEPSEKLPEHPVNWVFPLQYCAVEL